MTQPITRRDAIGRLAIGAGSACASAGLLSCGGASGPGSSRDTVVLYSSVDSWLLKQITPACERETGVRLSTVGDTEATKTTGLVTRLLAERDAPRADVWWSSEPFGTIRLARDNVLTPYTSEPAEGTFTDGWPAHLRAQDQTWYGFALRARVIAFPTDRIAEGDTPRSLAALQGDRWRGRVGIARPHFGTTRGHVGALHAAWGEDAYAAWCARMRDHGLRVYNGNATVVRKIAEGEIDVGLTDTDDVRAAADQGLKVGMVFEQIDHQTDERAQANSDPAFPSFGPMVIPNTVGLVAGGPNPEGGKRVIDWLLSGAAERLLAASPSGNYPVHPGVSTEFPELTAPASTLPPLADAEAGIEPALATWDRIFG